MTLAESVDKVSRDWDPYGYRDSECSVEYFQHLLDDSPEIIIEGLLDIIYDMAQIYNDVRLGGKDDV